MKATDYKIVILSPTNLSCSTATGSLMYRLFKNWSPENIFQVSKHWHDDEVSRIYSQQVPFRDFMESWRVSRNLLKRGLAIFLRKVFFFLRFYYGNKEEVIAAVSDFKPDIIYLRVVGEPYYYLNLALTLKQELEIPLVCHFMDDFELRLDFEKKFSLPLRLNAKLYRFYLNEVLMSSELRFAISESMAFTFSQRYGGEFNIVHNGIESEELDFHEKIPQRKINHDFKILWAGTVSKEKDDEVLEAVLEAVKNIIYTNLINIVILINAPEASINRAKKVANNYPFVKVQPYQPIKVYLKLLSSCNLLLIGRNFTELSKVYTQYSFHNKLTDFLASGTPVLSIGPSWSNTNKIFKKLHCGLVVESIKIEKIKKVIIDIILNYDEFSRVSKENSYKMYVIFKMDKIRILFEEKLSDIIIASKKS